jgi:PAS domain S-box-containing protein
MTTLSEWLFSNGLMPHGFCYQWKPTLIWLHAVSDTLIALAYFSIPVVLIYFVRRRRDLPFGWMFICFGVFISACGATHVMDVWTLWVPSYWFSGGVKVVTALASVPTAVFLVRLMPAALSLPSPEKMRTTIDQLKQQEGILKESEERFRRMAENIQEIFWTMDPETKEVTYASPAFEQICELPLDSLYSNPMSYLELIHPEDRRRVFAGLEKLKDTNRFDEEFRITCPSGVIKWLRGIGFVANDSEGKILTLLGTAQEITARKEMELQSLENEDRYRDLVEHSTDLICTYNLQGRLLSLNELPAKLLGYSREELLNMPLRNIVIPEARAQFDESLLTIQRDGFVKGSMIVITKTGERRIWEYHNTLRTEGVAVPVVRGMAHDITDRKHLEWALRLSEEKFAKAFHSSPVEIVITTLQEDIFLDVNAAFEQNSGFARDEVLGHTSIELGMWNNPDDRALLIEDIMGHGSLREREISFRTKSGKTRVTHYSAEQIKIGDKQCLLAVCEDITLRKQVEEALRISEEKFS